MAFRSFLRALVTLTLVVLACADPASAQTPPGAEPQPAPPEAAVGVSPVEPSPPAPPPIVEPAVVSEVPPAAQEPPPPEAAAAPLAPLPLEAPPPAPPSAAAEEDLPEPEDLEIHAFVSQGFLWTSENKYLADSDGGSFEFTEVGTNLTKQVLPEMRVGIQFFARDLGPIGDYKPHLDWYYLDYRFANWLGFRAGRVKLPFGLYNAINDVDSARAFVLLPQSLYPATSRDFLLAQTGFELYGYGELGDVGALDYRLYAGTIFIEADTGPSSPYEVETLHIPYVVGGRLLWETPLEGLRAGGSMQWLKLEGNLLYDPEVWMALQMMGAALPAGFDGLVAYELPALLWVGSIEWAADQALFAIEYGRWHVESKSSVPALFPASKTTSERMHAMLAFRVAPWLEPGVYYSLYFRDIDDRDRRSTHQHDVALAFRFDVNEHWLFKLEGHYLHGTAALDPGLNGGTPRADLEPNWFLVLAKTTAYF